MARWFLLCKSWSTPCVRCTIWQCARVIVRTLLEYMNHDFWLYSPSRNPKAQTTNGSRAPYKFHESNYSFHYNLDGKLFSSSKSVKEKRKKNYSFEHVMDLMVVDGWQLWLGKPSEDMINNQVHVWTSPHNWRCGLEPLFFCVHDHGRT